MAVTTILIARDAVYPDHAVHVSSPNPVILTRTILASELIQTASNGGTGGTGGGPGGLGDTAGGAAWMYHTG